MSAPGESAPRPDRGGAEAPEPREDRREDAAQTPGEAAPARAPENRERPRPRRKRRRTMEARDPQGRLVATIDRPRRYRLRRVALRGLIVAAVLLVAAFVAVQIVFHTALPRKLVVGALEKQFGLRISASGLTTGWMGHTTLRNVTMALPLAEESFLEVPELKVDHTNLFFLMLRRPLHLYEVDLVKPRLTVRQGPLGRWNVEEVFALITRASGGRSAVQEQQQQAGTPAQLPALNVDDGTVVLVDNQGKRAELKPLNVAGHPQSSVAWSFSAKAPQMQLEGRVAPGQNWEHIVTFAIHDVNALLAPWLAAAPSPLRLAGEWRGSATPRGVDGRVDLRDSRIGSVALAGVASIQEADGVATVTPQTLVAQVSGVSASPVRLITGSLKMSGTRVEAQQLRVGVMGGAARIDGQLDWHAMTGSVDAAWTDLVAPGGVRHEGSIKASVDMPWAKRPRIKAEIATRGFAQQRHWNGQVRLTGDGRSWTDIDWTVDVPTFTMVGPKHTGQVKDLGFELVSAGRQLRLANLHLADTDRVRGSGTFDLASHDWALRLDLQQMHLPRFTRPVDLAVDATGSPRRIDIKRLEWAAGKSQVQIAGFYEMNQPKPLDATVRFTRLPVAVRDPARVMLPAGSAGLRGHARATGTLLPIDVELDGELSGRSVYIGQRQLGDLAVRVRGHIGEEIATLESTELQLFDGDWSLKGQYLFFEEWGSLDLAVKNLSLKQLDALVQPPPDARGSLAADVHLEWPHNDTKQITASGRWSVKDLKKGPFEAQTATGRITMSGEEVTVDQVVLRQGKGEATAALHYNVREATRLRVEARGRDWPVELPESRGTLKVSADTQLDINLADKSAVGPVTFSAAAMLRDRYFGSATVSAEMRGQELHLTSAQANAFGGSLNGSGIFVLNNWPMSSGHFDVQGIEASSIVEMWPGARGLAGVFSGAVDIRHNFDPHATEPLVAEVRFQPAGAHYNAAQVGPMQLTFTAGPGRLVLAQGLFSVAGGEVTAWGRLSNHPSVLIGHAQVELRGLDMNQLVMAASPAARPTPGILDGEITVFGPMHHKDQIAGEANLRLTRMELLNLDVLTAMYAALNPASGPPPAHGQGSAFLRLEQRKLTLVSGFYRNQGIYVRAQAQLQDIFQGAASPITGFAVGTARPLSQIKLPFLAQVDDIISALQHAVTTFQIAGTAGAPRLQGAGFNEVSEGLMRLFVDDVKSEVQGSAAR